MYEWRDGIYLNPSEVKRMEEHNNKVKRGRPKKSEAPDQIGDIVKEIKKLKERLSDLKERLFNLI